jgi:hypothetical protein
MRTVISQAIRAINREVRHNLRYFWKGYNIWPAMSNLDHSWYEIKKSTMHGHWKKLRPLGAGL